MKDQAIVDLYWARDERAIEETSRKYGDYCFSIAHHILKNQPDSEEAVNDTWLQTWQSVPPQRPGILSSYLGTITRNLALSKYRASTALKRRGDRLAVAYEELEEAIPGHLSPEELVSARELGREIDQFLRTLPKKDCYLFIRRYWYLDSISQIARRYGIPEGSVKSRLHAVRQKLKAALQREGYAL